MYYTYVLLCRNNNKRELYIGSTRDLKNRIAKHKSKCVKTTKLYNSIKLIYYEACSSKTDARKREIQLKTGFGRGYIKKRLASDIDMRD